MIIHEPLDVTITWRDEHINSLLIIACMDYKYQALCGQSIRLFRYFFSEDGQVYGELETFSLSTEHGPSATPPYQAVSYTWGSSVCTAKVHIGRNILHILDAIDTFLWQMLSDGGEGWWWIDSICIDQKNEIEKGSQVALMGRIFADAQAVRVWLGEEADDSDLALDFLGFMGAGQKFSYHQNLPSKGLVDELRAKDGPYTRKWAAVNKLFKRSWWTRVWTVQEYVVAHEAWIHCGGSRISRDDFQRALEAIYDCGIHLDTPAQWNRARLLNRYRDSLRSRDSKVSGSLTATLAYLSDHHATNPRDRIYSLSGIVKDFDMVGPPNYSQSVEVVFVKLVEAFIRRYRSLDIICLATVFQGAEDIEERTLPSWTPDWRKTVHPLVTPSMASQGSISFIGNFRPGFRRHTSTAYRASGYSYPEVIFSPDLQAINCQGFVLGKIDGLAGLSSHEWSGSTSPDYSMIEATESSQESIEVQTREISDIMQSLMRCLVLDRQDHYLNDQPQGHDFISQFQTLLSMAQRHHSALRGTFRQWYDANKDFRVRGETLHSLVSQYLGDEVVAPPHTLPDEERRKSFYSRFHDTTVKMSRRLVVFESGVLGTAPSRARKGDEVCILFGCNIPVVLRPRGTGDGFEFVGECYVDGFMEGEALRSPAADHCCIFSIA